MPASPPAIWTPASGGSPSSPPGAWSPAAGGSPASPPSAWESPADDGPGVLMVTGALSSEFPPLKEAGTSNSKPFYSEFPPFLPGPTRAGARWDGSKWTLRSPDDIWESTDDVATPDLVTTWTPTGGATGTPVVRKNALADTPPAVWQAAAGGSPASPVHAWESAASGGTPDAPPSAWEPGASGGTPESPPGIWQGAADGGPPLKPLRVWKQPQFLLLNTDNEPLLNTDDSNLTNTPV